MSARPSAWTRASLLDGVPLTPALGDRSTEDALSTVRRRERVSKRTIAGADIAAGALAVLAAIEIGTGYTLRWGYLLVLPIILLVAKLQGLYDHDELVIRKSTLDELPRLVNLVTLVTLLLWISRHFVVIGAPSTWTLVKLWIGLLTFTTIGRIAARSFAARVSHRERCFFVGDISTAERLRTKFRHSSTAELVGAVTHDYGDLTPSDLRELIEHFDIHRIIISSSRGVAEEETNDLVRAAKTTGLRVTIAPGMLGVLGSSLVLDDVWGMPLLGMPRFGLSRSSGRLKRAFDLIGAAFGVLLCSPLLAIAALLIRLDSPGPIFFRQLRVGRNGEAFSIIKLRTMVADAEVLKDSLRPYNEVEGIFKIAADPRITRVGRLLRRSSIDELPQLLNVIRGQMSLVGPRPLLPDEDELVTGFDRGRLAITPGMTGPWQVLGSARIPLQEMIKLDYVYVGNWSLWLDVKILLRTAGVVLAQRGM